MADLPTMFSCNVLVATQTGHLALHYHNRRILLTRTGSTLSLAGSTNVYEIRPSGLAVLAKAPEQEEHVSPSAEGGVARPTEATKPTDTPANPPKPPEAPETYYIKASANGQLDTEDFGILSGRLWNKKPMPKGTQIAVAVIPRQSDAWAVPGTATLSFLPLRAEKPGNFGEILVTSHPPWPTPPLWNLEGPLTDGYLFYTLLKDLDKPTYFTAN